MISPRAPIEHELKTIEPFFSAVVSGEKTFEARFNDRDFRVGDILWLRAFAPATRTYDGRSVRRRVTYILDKPVFMQPGYVILGMRET